jgi:hypothetical protein
MMTPQALSQVAVNSTVRAGLRRSRVYQILQPGQRPMSGSGAIPVMHFSSVPSLQAAISGGQLPAGTRAVLYDPERWSFTPVSEQRNPVGAAQRAAAIAHAHSLLLIVAPGLDLVSGLSPSRAPYWQKFLSLRLAAGLARVADGVELQAQSLERDTATYVRFVRAAARQARAASPGITVLAGLSTNPPGASVASSQLSAAAIGAGSAIDGFWLNIPGRGVKCPRCQAINPEIGVLALQSIL